MKTEMERLSVRLVVLTEGQHSLAKDFAALAEEMNERFDAVDARFDAVDARFDALTTDLKKAIADGNAALISAVVKLGKR